MSLTTEHLSSLNLARYEFHLRAHQDVVLPPFLGSTLRGSFGHALKEITCSISHRDCHRCLLVSRCTYPQMFETSAEKGGQLLAKGQQAPRPFIFTPPSPKPPSGLRARDDLLRWRIGVRAGQSLKFGLTLIGSAIADLPYVIHAVSLMAYKGLGAERARFSIDSVKTFDVDGNAKLVYTPAMSRVVEHPECLLTLRTLAERRLVQLAQVATEKESYLGMAVGSQILHRTQIAIQPARTQSNTQLEQLTLQFLTPTRLRVKGELLENVSFSQIVSSISLRLSNLAALFGDAPLRYDYKEMLIRARNVQSSSSALRLMMLDRYTNHQERKLSMDGIMGEITFRARELADFLPLLIAGEFLRIGSATAFGLGEYRIDPD